MTRTPTFTPIRVRIYNFIVEFKSNHNGNSPTIREIADGVCLASTNTVEHHLAGLEKLGVIELGKQSEARMISVVGSAWLAPSTENVTALSAHWIGVEA